MLGFSQKRHKLPPGARLGEKEDAAAAGIPPALPFGRLQCAMFEPSVVDCSFVPPITGERLQSGVDQDPGVEDAGGVELLLGCF